MELIKLDEKLNKEVKIFYVPKNPISRNKRYIPVGVYQLHKYIGEYEAFKAVRSFVLSKLQSDTKKLRSGDRLKFYRH